MPYLLVHQTLEDYDRWRPVFHEMSAVRKAFGSKGARAFRSADNPNQVAILVEWENLEQARRYGQSEEARAAIQRGGVIGRPDAYFFEEEEAADA